MYYEPDTVWGRTIEGDEEVTTPRSGLSLVQRRVLAELGRPRTFAALAARHRLEAPKLEHELISLAERRLVAFQRASDAEPRTAPRINLPLMPDGSLVAEQWKPSLPVYFLAAAVGISTVLVLIW